MSSLLKISDNSDKTSKQFHFIISVDENFGKCLLS